MGLNGVQESLAFRGRILVVDDENGPRQSLRLLLNEEHDVFLAADVKSARSILESVVIDLVITDVRMPRETGVDLLRWIKTRQPDTEVIILTGYGELESAKEAVAFGAFAYLEKPFDSAAMMKCVNDALHRRRHELERRQMEELALEANRFETLGHFVSGMLHDLGTPLSVIGSHLEMILQDPPAGTFEKRLRTMQVQTNHCREIVRAAMGFLRHKSNEFTDLNLNEVLQNCLQVAQPILLRRSIAVRTDLSETLPACRGDFVLVRQALLNLITNACQAMEEQTEPRELHIRTWHDKTGVFVAVGDTGPGIPAENRERVFRRFFTTKGENGSGLGLAAVRNIMHRHNGEVELQEKHGRGALFLLTFPGGRA